MLGPTARLDIDRERCERSLHHFTRSGWRYIDPAPFVDNWHLGAMAEHLEAVTLGQIRFLLICIPPRHAKSLMTCVSFPAFTWALDRTAGKYKDAPLAGPGVKFLTLSYGKTLSERDAVKTRWLLDSEWYQDRWGDRWKMRADQNQKDRYVNDAGGHRIPSAVDALGTGEGGDILIVDDAHNVLDAESDAIRNKTVQWYREVLPTRMNDQQTGAMVAIMQRTHEGDVPGYIIENEPDYVKLVLPARYERDHPQVWKRDPRVEGQLLWPEKIPERELARLERTLGIYAAAGQLQQRPSPREGGMFKVDNIEIIDRLPPIDAWSRAWDMGGTQGAGDPTAGVLLGRRADGLGYVVADVRRDQLSPLNVQRLIKETALLDTRAVKIRLTQDPGQAGKGQADDYRDLLDGWPLVIRTVTGRGPNRGNKELRATPVSAQVEAGRIFLLKGDWNDTFIAELRMFPGGKNDDQVDAFADAHAELIGEEPFVPSEAVARARANAVTGVGPVVFGIDARNAKDIGIVDRQGRRMGQRACLRLRGDDLTEAKIVAEIAKLIRQWMPETVFINLSGYGAELCDKLVALGFSNRCWTVNFGGDPVGAGPSLLTQYADWRGEGWDAMREWFENAAGVQCADDQQLHLDVCGPAWGKGMTRRDAAQRLIMEDRGHLEERTGADAVLGEAAALTFAAPVYDNEADYDETTERSDQHRRTANSTTGY